MTLQNHPDDERLAALAGADLDATGDRELRDHVAGCERCRALTGDLGTLRSTLAELPEIALPAHLPPFRLPPVAADRRPALGPRGGFFENLRRVLVPSMVGGAALALVGAVGTSGYLASELSLGAGGDTAMPARAPADGSEEDSGAGGAEGAEIEAESTEGTAEMYVTRSDPHESPQGDGVAVLWVTLIIAGVAIVFGAFLLRRTLPRPSI